MSVIVIWTDYEECEVFVSREDAENYCHNNYGPDKKTWPSFDERETRSVERKNSKEYVAIAWWPDWVYKKAPLSPYVRSAYGEKPNIDGDRKGDWLFEAEGRTEAEAERRARELAVAERPVYVYAQSSATSSGDLAVFRRADFRGRVGSW